MFDGEKKEKESRKDGKKVKDPKPKDVIKQRDAYCKFVCYTTHLLSRASSAISVSIRWC